MSNTISHDPVVNGVILGCCLLFVVLLFVTGALLTRAERRERRDLALFGRDGSVTITSIKSVRVGGSRSPSTAFTATCDVEVSLATVGTFRDASEGYRLTDAELSGVPLHWLPRFQAGLVLRARLRPTQRGNVWVYFEHDPEGTVYEGRVYKSEELERSERMESQEFAQEIEATVTVVSIENVAIRDNKLRIACELDVDLSTDAHRLANTLIIHRLPNVSVQAPLEWMTRFQPGLVLRGRAHPTKVRLLRLYLLDGPGEGRTLG